MKTSDETKNIIQALVKAQASFESVKKDRQNPFANSAYATLDAILEEVLPKLTENGIALTQEPVTSLTENGLKIGVITRLFHTSGEFMEYDPLFMELEKGAKMNMAQSAGSVITYAKRYAISAILGISTDEDNDGVQPKGGKQHDKRPQQKQPPQDDNAQKIEQAIQEYQDFLLDHGRNLGELNQYIIKQEKVQSIDQVDRLRVMGYYKAFAKKQETDNLKAERERQQQAQSRQQQSQEPQQQSLMDGRTTNVIDWGNK
ncbi:ERF family protein [Bacillus subtilis]